MMLKIYLSIPYNFLLLIILCKFCRRYDIANINTDNDLFVLLSSIAKFSILSSLNLLPTSKSSFEIFSWSL